MGALAVHGNNLSLFLDQGIKFPTEAHSVSGMTQLGPDSNPTYPRRKAGTLQFKLMKSPNREF